jgi:phosphonate transport system substrate-binding protein
MLRRTFCAALIAASFATPVLAQDAGKTLNFGIISTESTSALKSSWQPVINDLSKALGVTVKPFFASDYAGIIEAMRFNKVQVAWYGNQSAIEAVDRSNGEVFAAVIDKNGDPGYWSILLVNKNSDLKDVADIIARGKSLNYGMGDPNSTSGTAVPGFYLWGANHVDPKTLFKTARVANHETNLMSVINKQVDVAICNTETLEHYRKNTGKDPMADVRVVWKSPLIPADPLVWRKDLAPEMKQKVQAFFVNYGKTGPNAATESANLAAMNYQGFHASNDLQLVPIRQMGLASDKLKIMADTTLSADERTKQLAAADVKLAELDKLAKATAAN